MFIPFNIIMLPPMRAKQVSFFDMDNVPGLIILYIVMGLPMNIFLYSGYVNSIPDSNSHEAATIDSMQRIPSRCFRQATNIPTLKPMKCTVAILTFSHGVGMTLLCPWSSSVTRSNQTLQLAQTWC